MSTMSPETLKVQIIQKAWADPAFKASLLADPKQAISSAFGIAIPDHIQIQAIQETPDSYILAIPPNPEDVGSGTSSPNGLW